MVADRRIKLNFVFGRLSFIKNRDPVASPNSIHLLSSLLVIKLHKQKSTTNCPPMRVRNIFLKRTSMAYTPCKGTVGLVILDGWTSDFGRMA